MIAGDRTAIGGREIVSWRPGYRPEIGKSAVVTDPDCPGRGAGDRVETASGGRERVDARARQERDLCHIERRLVEPQEPQPGRRVLNNEGARGTTRVRVRASAQSRGHGHGGQHQGDYQAGTLHLVPNGVSSPSVTVSVHSVWSSGA